MSLAHQDATRGMLSRILCGLLRMTQRALDNSKPRKICVNPHRSPTHTIMKSAFTFLPSFRVRSTMPFAEQLDTSRAQKCAKTFMYMIPAWNRPPALNNGTCQENTRAWRKGPQLFHLDQMTSQVSHDLGNQILVGRQACADLSRCLHRGQRPNVGMASFYGRNCPALS